MTMVCGKIYELSLLGLVLISECSKACILLRSQQHLCIISLTEVCVYEMKICHRNYSNWEKECQWTARCL